MAGALYRGTHGAEFNPSLNVPEDAVIISKAMKRNKDASSGFQDTDLAELLHKNRVTELFVGGLTTDYCVKNTVLDALTLGFEVNILTDCTKGVNMKPMDTRECNAIND